MKTSIGSSKNGFSLVEILLAVALFSLIGVFLMSLISSGAQVGARASELRMATILASRVMDRLVASGYMGLKMAKKRHGAEGALDLRTLGRGPGPHGGGKGKPPWFPPGGEPPPNPEEGGPEPGSQVPEGVPTGGLGKMGQRKHPFPSGNDHDSKGGGAKGRPHPEDGPVPGDDGPWPPPNNGKEPDVVDSDMPVPGMGHGPGTKGGRHRKPPREGGDGEEGEKGEKGRPKGERPPESSRKLISDGFSYSGRFRLEDTGTGLMKVHIHLAWERYGVNGPKAAGGLDLFRYVSNPMPDLSGQGSSEEGPP